MDRNGTPYAEPPYMKPPPMSVLQTLPPELLHKIFSNLESLVQLVAMRETCSLLASIGLDHFNDEVSLVFHRDRFRAITEIAAHPKLSKHMRSLFYMADRNKLLDFEKWDIERPYPEPSDEELRRMNIWKHMVHTNSHLTRKKIWWLCGEKRVRKTAIVEQATRSSRRCAMTRLKSSGKDTTEIVYVRFSRAVRNCAKSPLPLRDPVCVNWMPIECLRKL